MNNFNKIHIYLRQYSRNRINPDRPSWFNYEKTFVNFLKATNWDLCNLTICFEKKEDYYKYFTKNYEKYFNFRVEFIDTDPLKWNNKCFEPVNWSRSLAATVEVIKNDITTGVIKTDHLLAPIEDDYLFLKNWDIICIDFFNNFLFNDNNYVSPYEHPDKLYCIMENRSDSWSMYSKLESKIRISNFRHWRTVPSTSMTVIIPCQTFMRDISFWQVGMSDCQICYESHKKFQTQFWNPITSLAVHAVNPWISPFVDWSSLYNL